MAGTVTQKVDKFPGRNGFKVLTFSWTGAADDGTVPSTATSAAITAEIAGCHLVEVRTNPGSTAPTAAYDIALNDTDGIDLMGGALNDRSATASERAAPKVATGVYGSAAIDGAITMVITNQAVHSATGTVRVFMEE